MVVRGLDRTSRAPRHPAARLSFAAANYTQSHSHWHIWRAARGGMSAKYAPHPFPRGSSRHGQSAERRRTKSSSKISDPNFTARRKPIRTGSIAKVAAEPDQHVWEVDKAPHQSIRSSANAPR